MLFRSGDSNTVAMNGSVDFPKKKLAHQCPGSALGRPGWRGMPSPGYSALPQELLLEVEPRRPGEKRPGQLHRALSPQPTGPRAGFACSTGPVPGVLSRSFPTRIRILKELELTPQAGWGSPGQTWGVGRARGLLTPVVVVGGHERAAGGDGCHALACGLVEPCARGGRGVPSVTAASREGHSPSGPQGQPRGLSGGAEAGFVYRAEAGLRNSGTALSARAALTSPNRPRGTTKALCARGRRPGAPGSEIGRASCRERVSSPV